MDELNVKVGDKVLLISGYVYSRCERIATVVKITPTGRIKIDGSDVYFDKYGEEMGRKNAWRPKDYIKIPKEEDYQRLKYNSDIRSAKNICNNLIGKMTPEIARKIIENFGDRS